MAREKATNEIVALKKVRMDNEKEGVSDKERVVHNKKGGVSDKESEE